MSMISIDDPAQLSKTLLYNINKTWIKKESDFWVSSAINYRISSGFGTRRHPLSGIAKHHNGVDISSPVREVIATASGFIKATCYDEGLRYFVIIDHQNSYQTTYGHLSKILAQKIS